MADSQSFDKLSCAICAQIESSVEGDQSIPEQTSQLDNILLNSGDKIATPNILIDNDDINLPSYLEECEIENAKHEIEISNSCFEQGNDSKQNGKEIYSSKPQISSTERHVKKRKKTKNSRKLEKILVQNQREEESHKILSDIEYEMRKYGFEESIKPINTQSTLREVEDKTLNSPKAYDEYSVKEKKKFTRNNSQLHLQNSQRITNVFFMNRTSVNNLKSHDYSAIKVKPQFNDYLKSVKKSGRRVDSPSTEVVNKYRSNSGGSKEDYKYNLNTTVAHNKSHDIKFNNIQMLYVPKDTSNSGFESENEYADKCMSKLEKITKQKIKELKNQND